MSNGGAHRRQRMAGMNQGIVFFMLARRRHLDALLTFDDTAETCPNTLPLWPLQQLSARPASTSK
jgi:hypothetical protein